METLSLESGTVNEPLVGNVMGTVVLPPHVQITDDSFWIDNGVRHHIEPSVTPSDTDYLWTLDFSQFTKLDSVGELGYGQNFYLQFNINAGCQVDSLDTMFFTLNAQLFCGSSLLQVYDSGYANRLFQQSPIRAFPPIHFDGSICGPFIHMDSVAGMCAKDAYYRVWGNSRITQAPLEIVWTGGIDSITQNSVDTTTDTTIMPLNAGTYYVVVTDKNGCTASDSAMSISSGLTVLATGTDFICEDDNYGIISVNASDGFSPYRYNWSGGDTSSTRSGLAPGLYIVSVTDTSGCTKVDSINIAADSSCCHGDSTYTFGSITARQLADFLHLSFDPSNYGYILDLGNTTIAFNDTFAIDTPFAFISSKNVVFGPGAVVLVDSALGIINSNLYACDSILWHGIMVSHTSSVTSILSTISDAQYAIETVNGSSINIIATAFQNDFIGIFYNGPINSAPLSPGLNVLGSIYGNTFTGGPLLAPYAGMVNANKYQPASSLTKWSWAGMQLDNLPTMSVGLGIFGDSVYTNRFDSLANGIISRNCALSVMNSSFNQIYNWGYNDTGALYGPVQGNGILAMGTKDTIPCIVAAGSIIVIDGDSLYDSDTSTVTSVNGCPTVLYGSLYQRGFGKYGPPSFTQCTRGISTYNIAVDIAQNYIYNYLDSSVAGLRITYGKGATIKISDNWIYDKQIGIELLNNDPVRSDLVNNNLIDIYGTTGAVNGIGIEVSENGNPPQTAGAADISANTVNMQTGAMEGMYINESYGLIVNNDTVNLQYVADNLVGMEFDECTNLYDYQNIVAGGDVVTNASDSHRPVGIHYLSTSGTGNIYATHSCNTVKNLHIGMEFSGANLLTDLTSNNFNDPITYSGALDTALLIDDSATINAQSHQANKWWGSSSQYSTAANNNNTSIPVLILEHFDVATNPPFLPPSFSPTLNWIVPGGNDTDKCSDTIIYPPFPPDTGGFHIAHIIASDSLLISGALNPELNWQNGIIIFGWIFHNRVLAGSDAIVQQFFNTEDTAAMGHLVMISDSVHHQITPGNPVLTQMHMVQDTITVLKNAIMHIDTVEGGLIDNGLVNNTIRREIIIGDEVIFPTDTAIYDSVIQIVISLKGFIENTDSLQYLDSVKITLNSALIVQEKVLDSLLQVTNTVRYQKMQLTNGNNSSINPTLDIETWYKEINDVYLNSIAVDGVSFDSSQLAILQQLAFMCPLIGGEAVFRARAMLAMVENNVYYDDLLCIEPEHRMAKVHKNSDTTLVVKMYPNPARDYAILEFSGDLNQPMQLKISDGLGRYIMNSEISPVGGVYLINTSNYSEGIYYVTLYDKTGKIFGEKLCIFIR